jgi:hypothetical protein
MFILCTNILIIGSVNIEKEKWKIMRSLEFNCVILIIKKLMTFVTLSRFIKIWIDGKYSNYKNRKTFFSIKSQGILKSKYVIFIYSLRESPS